MGGNGTVYVSSFVYEQDRWGCGTVGLHTSPLPSPILGEGAHPHTHTHSHTIFHYKAARHAKHTKHACLTTFGRYATASPSLTMETFRSAIPPSSRIYSLSRKDISDFKSWFRSLVISGSLYENRRCSWRLGVAWDTGGISSLRVPFHARTSWKSGSVSTCDPVVSILSYTYRL